MLAVIILARGGSKGVPRKNLAVVGGQTLLSRAIRTSQRAIVRNPTYRGNLEHTPRVYVSTEDEGIAYETLACGADLIQRPRALSTDESQAIDALRHAWSRLQDRGITRIANVQCTSPLLTANDIRKTVHALEMGFDLTIATVPFHGVVFSSDSRLLTHDPTIDGNRQGQDQMQRVAGSVWAFRPEYLDQDWYSGNVGLVPSDNPTHLEIDTEADLDVARLVVPGIESECAGGAGARESAFS